MILKEYALDPNLINNWANCRLYLQPFDVLSGRQISAFPAYKDWNNLRKKNLDSDVGPRGRKKIVEYIRNKKKLNGFAKRNALYRKSLPWIENAKSENEKNPFQGIVCRESDDSQDNVINYEEFSDQHPLMEASVGKSICQNAKELTAHLRPLLDQSKIIIFIDPYFRAGRPDFMKPLELFLEMIATNPRGINRLHILYHHNNGTPNGEFLSEEKIIPEYKEKLQHLIPVGLELSMCMWDFYKLHNRYVLTDIMGVAYGKGLSESSNSFNNKDEIYPLDRQSHKERLDEFSNNELIQPYLVLKK